MNPSRSVRHSKAVKPSNAVTSRTALSWQKATSPHPARRWRNLLPLIAMFLVFGALVSSCSSAQSASTSGAAVDTAGKAAAPASAPVGGGTAGSVPAILTGPTVVVTADVSYAASNVIAATRTLSSIVTKYGAQVTAQQSSAGDPKAGSSSGAQSVTTIRVLPSRVSNFINGLSVLGTQQSVTVSSTDVGTEVADVSARLVNARSTLASLRLLMGRATDISDVIKVETQLTARQGDLEALEARQRVLASTTAQATVTVTIASNGGAVVATAADSGFVSGLRTGWSAFTTTVAGALTALGVLLPFLLVLFVILAAGFVLRRRRNRQLPTSSPS